MTPTKIGNVTKEVCIGLKLFAKTKGLTFRTHDHSFVYTIIVIVGKLGGDFNLANNYGKDHQIKTDQLNIHARVPMC